MTIATSKRDISMLPATRRLTEVNLLLILACALVSLLTLVFADDSKAADQVNSIDRLVIEIKRESKRINDLEKRLTGAEGIVKAALDSRMIRSRMNLLEQNL